MKPSVSSLFARTVQHAKDGALVAGPWTEEHPYRIRKGCLEGRLCRKDAVGRVLCAVQTSYDLATEQADYRATIAKETASFAELAAAMADAEARLLVQGYALVGRVVWA